MSGILDHIDDTLADWDGSADSMRWRPAGSVGEHGASILVTAGGFTSGIRDVLLRTTTVALDELPLYLQPFTLGVEFPLAEPAPGQDYWEAAALRRVITAAFDIPPRALGLAPRYGFDARYRQRQKNRSKRRRRGGRS